MLIKEFPWVCKLLIGLVNWAFFLKNIQLAKVYFFHIFEGRVDPIIKREGRFPFRPHLEKHVISTTKEYRK